MLGIWSDISLTHGLTCMMIQAEIICTKNHSKGAYLPICKIWRAKKVFFAIPGPIKDSGWKAPDDNFFLSDNRTWTSVKDNHLKQLSNETSETKQKLPNDGVEKRSKNKVETAAIITPLSSD